MATTVWKGQLTFALVSFPVRLFRAARAERVHFKGLHRQARPIPLPRTSRTAPEPAPEILTPTHNAIVTPDRDEPLQSREIVRGFEVDKDQYVVVEDEEIRQLAPETSDEMQVVEFVDFSEIDPVYLETSYYVKPDEVGEHPYALLFEAMRKSGYAGLAQLAMHRREHVVVLRPGRTGILAHTMFYPDEVRSSQEFRTDTSTIQKRELDLATRLIGTMVVPFEPEKFRDTYRERLEQLIRSKQQSTPAAARRKPAKPEIDILAALQKSLKQSRRAS
jgi:DNA end-binding protein Ku